MLACNSEHNKNESKCPVLNRHQYVRKRKIETHAGLSVLTYLATMLARVPAWTLDKIRHMRVRVGV